MPDFLHLSKRVIKSGLTPSCRLQESLKSSSGDMGVGEQYVIDRRADPVRPMGYIVGVTERVACFRGPVGIILHLDE